MPILLKLTLFQSFFSKKKTPYLAKTMKNDVVLENNHQVIGYILTIILGQITI